MVPRSFEIGACYKPSESEIMTVTDELSEYFGRTRTGLEHCDSVECAQALSLRSTLRAVTHLRDTYPRDIQNAVRRAVTLGSGYKECSAAWQDVVARHLCVGQLLAQGQVEDAHAEHLELMKQFRVKLNTLTGDGEANWLVEAMAALCYDARCLSFLVDDHKYTSGEYKVRCWKAMENGAQEINNVIRICGMDRKQDASKKSGAMRIANELFKIYFRVGYKNQLSKRLFSSIEQLSSNVWEDFAPEDIVTYKYFHGKNALLVEQDVDAALASLDTAYAMCPASCAKNRRAIAVYLAVCKMMKGWMPSDAFLLDHRLDELGEVKRAVAQGNVAAFDEAMDRHEEFMARWGIDFLVRGKLLVHTHRNLMKKVWIILGTHQIPFYIMVRAFQVSGVPDCDAMEVECLLANMVFEGHIKGYITHAHQMLVVSKTDPFPRVVQS